MAKLLRTTAKTSDVVDLTADSEGDCQGPGSLSRCSSPYQEQKITSSSSQNSTTPSANHSDEGRSINISVRTPLPFASSAPQRHRRPRKLPRRARNCQTQAAVCAEVATTESRIDAEPPRAPTRADIAFLAAEKLRKKQNLKKARALAKISIATLADAVESEQVEMPEEYEHILEEFWKEDEKKREELRKHHGMKYPAGVTGAEYESILAEAIGRRDLKGFNAERATRETWIKIAYAIGSISCGINYGKSMPRNGGEINAIHEKIDRLWLEDREIQAILDPYASIRVVLGV